MGEGFLLVNVADALQAPLEGINVQVFDAQQQALFSLYTDAHGQCGPLALKAPPKKHTLCPSAPIRYATYDITVFFGSRYIETIVRGIQIFDTVTSVQSVTGHLNLHNSQPIVIEIPAIEPRI